MTTVFTEKHRHAGHSEHALVLRSFFFFFFPKKIKIFFMTGMSVFFGEYGI